ncbi:MAG: UDP-N-acetylmuramoyl-tripeptide--D-alanyl-D-alanine ligase [Deltaproteobacteria bacterium]|jgi:UDP-N-acetylmuramoyl-tripeptide--D-alanyl-D-alanine ligase|nr:UDP-N-acetylmuramoyl-tripeptide--D-alanyl-D-alanine ligase [Deltaproteobacteria bacterium]
MSVLKVKSLLDNLNGTIINRGTISKFNGFCLDSREAKKNNLFFAVKGENADGHNFIDAAFDKGATGAVVSRKIQVKPQFSHCLVLQVDNVITALWQAGIELKKSIPSEKIAAITGSCGKTSTKELLKAALSEAGKTGATRGNYNNELGLPLTLSWFEGDEDFHVLELGMNNFGEIDKLARLVEPQVGIITSIRPVHLEGVGNLEGVRKAKGELIPWIRSGGTAVLPISEKSLIEKAVRQGLKVLTFGKKPADFAILDYESNLAGSTFKLRCHNKIHQVKIPLPGEHQILNCSAALAASTALGIDLKTAIRGVTRVQLPGQRSKIHKRGKLYIFDDSYNSSPAGAEAVLKMASDIFSGPVVAILGDMLELGDKSSFYHHQLGKTASKLDFSKIVYVGDFYSDFKAGLDRDNLLLKADSPAQAVEKIFPFIKNKHCLLLVKASRKLALDKSIKILLDKLL